MHKRERERKWRGRGGEDKLVIACDIHININMMWTTKPTNFGYLNYINKPKLTLKFKMFFVNFSRKRPWQHWHFNIFFLSLSLSRFGRGRQWGRRRREKKDGEVGSHLKPMGQILVFRPLYVIELSTFQFVPEICQLLLWIIYKMHKRGWD